MQRSQLLNLLVSRWQTWWQADLFAAAVDPALSDFGTEITDKISWRSENFNKKTYKTLQTCEPLKSQEADRHPY